jgi:hypothetical protein
MKNKILKFGASGLGLVLASFLLSSTARGGPGIEYWKSLGQPAAQPAKSAVAKPDTCTGSELVPNMVMRPSWSNQRGPLVAVQVGTKRVCTSCPVTSVETTYALANQRGPSVQTKNTKMGVTHDCGDACGKGTDSVAYAP